jgi:hypothetical protein
LAGQEGKSGGSRALEERVDKFASEIATLINGAAPELRKDLRDLATGLLRERVEEAEVSPGVRSDGAVAAPLNPLAVAIPLLLVGVLLVFLFPPVGLVILAFAVLMLVWGLIASLLFRTAKK